LIDEKMLKELRRMSSERKKKRWIRPGTRRVLEEKDELERDESEIENDS
jgi:hypothetical protein